MFSASNNNCPLFLLLCFSLATFVHNDPTPERKELVDSIIRGVSVTDTDDDLLKNVEVRVSVGAETLTDDHDILINDPQTVVGQSDGLYSLMTCNVGEWALIHVDHFLRTFQTSADDIHKLEDRVTKVTVAIREVLNAALYYADTSVLKPLMAIKYKCDLITSRNLLTAVDTPEAMTIFRGMLRDIRTVQTYLLMNCGTLNVMEVNPTDGEELERLTEGINKDSVSLDKIIQLDLPKICSLNQVLLENFVSVGSSEPHSIEILDVNVSITDHNWMKIKDILQVIPQSAYDVEVMFRYAVAVLPAIFKVIYCKVLVLSPGNYLKGEIADVIGEITSAIAQYSELYPPYFVENFEFLKEKLYVQSDLEKRYSQIDGVTIECPADEGGEVDVSLVRRTSEELSGLLRKILENIKDVTCYQRNFRFLHLELDKTYNSRSAKQAVTVLKSDRWCFGSANTCKFMTDAHVTCHETVSLLDAGKLNDAWKSMDFVKQGFLSAVETDYEDDLDLFETAVDVSIALTNQNEPTTPEQGERFRRAVLFAVAEIEEYGLQHCTSQPPKFKYYAFNDDVHFDRFTTAVAMNEPAGSAVECFGPKFLRQKFQTGSGFLTPYADTVRVLWKGTDQSIGDVFRETTSAHVSPRYLRALYDVYFKYHVAVLFYETTVVSQYLGDGAKPPTNLSASLKAFDLRTCFPDQLWYLIDDVTALLEQGGTQTPEDKIARLEKTEMAMFKIPKPTKNATLDDASKAFSAKIQGFIDGVKATVCSVNACYAKITRQIDDDRDVPFKSPRIFT